LHHPHSTNAFVDKLAQAGQIDADKFPIPVELNERPVVIE
jgi:hypothetical protein